MAAIAYSHSSGGYSKLAYILYFPQVDLETTISSDSLEQLHFDHWVSVILRHRTGDRSQRFFTHQTFVDSGNRTRFVSVTKRRTYIHSTTELCQHRMTNQINTTHTIWACICHQSCQYETHGVFYSTK